MDLEQLNNLQARLAQQVVVCPNGQGYIPQQGDIIYTLDIQYVEDEAFIAVDVLQYPNVQKGVFVGHTIATIPYIPQYFCFREGPLLLGAIQQIQRYFNVSPNVLIIDGHGIAHPRRLGVASWLGVQLGMPSIGIAKEPLLQYVGTLPQKRGDTLPILLDSETVGVALCTQDNVKPIFVSPGHQTSLETATQLALELASTYRQPEPIRRADHAARQFAKGIVDKHVIQVGGILGNTILK